MQTIAISLFNTNYNTNFQPDFRKLNEAVIK